MEIFFLIVLVVLMAAALSSGFPVAFALPGSAIITIVIAAGAGYIFAGDSDAFFVNGGPNQWLSAGVTNFRSLYWNVERDTLIAIPLFIFMGLALQRSRIAEDLLIAMAKLFGPVPGGLGISVVFVGALLAATTGIVGATVIAMGLISLPVMLRHNYSKELACGTICASGTLGQIIPPSIVLIILADQLSSAANEAGSLRKTLYKATTGEFSMPGTFDVISASAGDMFMGAFIPGIILVGLYMGYILITSLLNPKKAPPVPYEGKYDYKFFIEVTMALAPPLLLIFIVLGSIILGVATVNQAGAIGAIGALVMGSYRLAQGRKRAYYPALLALVSTLILLVLINQFELNIKGVTNTANQIAIYCAIAATLALLSAIVWAVIRIHAIDNTLNEIMIETAKTTSMVFIILIGAAMLTSAFRAFGGEEIVKHALTGLPGGFWTQFFVVMLIIFLLGFFLDFIEIAIVVVPLVAPILLANPAANVTAVWLGVMIGMNIQTSFLTPPFGFALFYLRGVASTAIQTLHIYKGVIAFILLQLVALVIAGIFPILINFLPNHTHLSSDTAPPPNNPQLQVCIEEKLFPTYPALQAPVERGLTSLMQLDLSYVPDKFRSVFIKSTENMPHIFPLVVQAETNHQLLVAYEVGYAPLHTEVRRQQRSIRNTIAAIERAQEAIDDLRFSAQPKPSVLQGLHQEIAELEARLQEQKRLIPNQWNTAHQEHSRLIKASVDSRTRYRRLADDSYSGLMDVRDMIQQTDALIAFDQQLTQLSNMVSTADSVNTTLAQIRSFEQEVVKYKNMQQLASLLRKATRALEPSVDDGSSIAAQEQLAAASAFITSEIDWRKRGKARLLPALNEFDALIKTNIGLRMQDRLPEGSESAMARCLSQHRNLSLFF